MWASISLQPDQLCTRMRPPRKISTTHLNGLRPLIRKRATYEAHLSQPWRIRLLPNTELWAQVRATRRIIIICQLNPAKTKTQDFQESKNPSQAGDDPRTGYIKITGAAVVLLGRYGSACRLNAFCRSNDLNFLCSVARHMDWKRSPNSLSRCMMHKGRDEDELKISLNSLNLEWTEGGTQGKREPWEKPRQRRKRLQVVAGSRRQLQAVTCTLVGSRWAGKKRLQALKPSRP